MWSSAARKKETVCYFHTSTLPTSNLKLRGSVKVCVGREITGDRKSLEIWIGNKFRFNLEKYELRYKERVSTETAIG